MRRLSLQKFAVLAALALCGGGCVSPAKTFHAPDPAKVIASTKRLSDSVAKATATAERAAAHVQAAQKAADIVAAESASGLSLINELLGLVPPELKGKVENLRESFDRQQVAEGDLSVQLSGAQKEHEQLAKENAESKAAKIALESDQGKYQGAASQLALAATKSDQARYAAQSQLIQQKIWRWAWRIGGGLIVLVIILLFVAGKISIAGIRAYLHI